MTLNELQKVMIFTDVCIRYRGTANEVKPSTIRDWEILGNKTVWLIHKLKDGRMEVVIK